MSFQIAMMAGMAAMTVAQTAAQASAAGAAAGRAGASIGEAKRQAAIEANLASMGSEVRVGAANLQAAQTDVTAAEVGIQARQRELARRQEMTRLGQANLIDMVARGGIATGQDSLAAIDRGNLEAGEADIENIKMMGESAKRQLSFRKSNFELQAMGEKLRSIFGDTAAEGKQRSLDLQAEDVRARGSEAMTSALLAGGGKLFQVGLMYDDGGKGGGKGGGKDPNVLGGP
jgi:hypothetical protein